MNITKRFSVLISLALHIGVLVLLLYSASNSTSIRRESRQKIVVSVISASKFDAEISTSPKIWAQTFQKVKSNRSENLDRKTFELDEGKPNLSDIAKFDSFKSSEKVPDNIMDIPLTNITLSQNPSKLIEDIRILDSDSGLYKIKEKSILIEVSNKPLLSKLKNVSPELHRYAFSIKPFTPTSPNSGNKKSNLTVNANINLVEAKFEPLSSSWGSAIEQQVLNNLIYPKKARNKLLSGKVFLKLEVFSDGTIVGVYVRQSSGHKILDKAARSAVFRARKFPSAPEDYPTKKFIFNLPIHFSV